MAIIMVGAVTVIMFLVGSILNIVLRQTRKIDWAITLTLSLVLSVIIVAILGIGPA